MSNVVNIAGVQSARIAFKGRPVCTTLQLAQFYGCESEHIQDNHRKNADRFEEGKHFVRIEGDAFRMFKEGLPENIRDPLKFAPKAILWTELGAARHAKMLTTDRAWDVFEEMEDAYFRTQDGAALSPAAKTARPRTITRSQVAAGILLLRSAAEDLKFSPSSVLGGYQTLESKLGIAGLLPAYAIDAPTSSTAGSSETTKSASWLLQKFSVGISPAAFNDLLVQKGFLKEDQRPTSRGGIKKFKVCMNLDFGKNITSPKNPRESQPHWYEDKFKALLDLVLPAKPTKA